MLALLLISCLLHTVATAVECKREYPEFRSLEGRDAIQLTDSMALIASKISRGNIGAARVLLDYVRTHDSVHCDPMTAEMGMIDALYFDTAGITGPRIW